MASCAVGRLIVANLSCLAFVDDLDAAAFDSVANDSDSIPVDDLVDCALEFDSTCRCYSQEALHAAPEP